MLVHSPLVDRRERTAFIRCFEKNKKLSSTPIPHKTDLNNFGSDFQINHFKMWRQLLSVLILTLAYSFGEVRAQEPIPQDDDDLLGDTSPPLSAEDGLTILGTGAVDVASTLSCHRRLYSYRVTKTDSAGRKCWGQVNVMSCWGRCDSNEIPDFRFPYKKSHHPVCIFGSRKPNVAILDNCDDEVEPGTNRYEYQEAESCQCSVCKSSEASCEGMRYRGVRSGMPGAY